MISVKFFGLLNVENNIKHLSIEEDNFKKVIDAILVEHPNITKNQLLKSIIFINKKQVSGKLSFNIRLNDGDEVVFISPSSGG